VKRARAGSSAGWNADVRYWIGVLLLVYPAGFRARFGPALRQAFLDGMEQHRVARRWFRSAGFFVRASLDAIVNGIAERIFERRRRDSRPAPAPRVLGVLGQDVRMAIRVMRRQPILTLLSILTVAVGIGASTAIFSLVDVVLLRPLPYPRAADLVSVSETVEGSATSVAYDNLLDWKRRARTLDALTPLQAQSVNLTGVAEPDRLRGGFVTSDFFAIVGTAPAFGRPLSTDDDQMGAAAVAVLDYRTWQGRFGGDPAIVGRSLSLNNTPVTVVGVMPDGFRFPFDDIEVWLPIQQFTGGLSRDQRSVFAVGRLRAGFSLPEAQSDLGAVAAQLEREHPKTNGGRGVRVEPFHAWLTTGIDRPLGVVFALVLVLLAIAAANVTSLQLGASFGRRSEVAVRVALGAVRQRIASQFLIEHTLLALAGGLVGIGIAVALVPIAVREAPLQLFGLDRVRIDARVLTFAFLTALAAGLASGVVPAIHWSRRTSAEALRASTRSTGERRLTRMRAGLVIAEVALSSILLVAGALLVRSYWRLLHTPMGFSDERVLSLEYRLPRNKYPTPAAQSAFHEAVVREARALPGVLEAAAVRALPFSGNGGTASYLTRPAASDASARTAGINTVTDDYFAVLQIPLLAGRTFGSQDHAESTPVVVVSRALAEAEWPAENPLGKEMRFVGVPVKPRVIGVVGDVRHGSLRDEQGRAVYVANRQNPAIFMTLAVRFSIDPSTSYDALRGAVWRVDSDQPVWKVRTLDSLVDRSVQLERFLIGVLGIFGAAALLLAVTGLSGAVAQSVQQRAKEIGVRLAVGATPSAAGRLIVRSGLSLTAVGLVLGLPVAALAARFMQSLLYQVGATDPGTYAAVAALLFVVSMGACVVPARRATKLDPATILRE
jgi:putative ABC transport system permease protein